MDKVTIYIPTKNRRELLSRAVGSVLAQDHPDIELIVVNDCSTDDTREYLDALTARETRVTGVHMPKSGGAPAARNLALRLATGTFITGLDDDDEFTAQRISTFVRVWAECESRGERPSCLFTASLMSDGVNAPTPNLPPQGARDHDVHFLDLFTRNVVGNQVFCPTERFRELGGFDESMPAWQDLELYMRLLRRYGPARRVDEPTYVCYVDEGRDRISGNHKNRRIAFAKISAKYPDVPVAQHQRLFLQMFSPFYGLVPSARDFAYLMRPRFAPHLLLRLAKWGLEGARLRSSMARATSAG